MLRDGKGVLLDFDARRPLQELAGRWPGRLLYVPGEVKERLGLSALLARPDGIVTWACENAVPLEEAAEAASRWFGEREPRHSRMPRDIDRP